MTAKRVLQLLSLLVIATPALAADDLDNVLKRYEEARGGLAAWRATETLSARGIYASFSHRKEFRLEMRQPAYFHFETESLGGATLWAADEKGPYWIYPAYDSPAWPVRVGPPSDTQYARMALFEPPLLDARAKGHRVKLIGPGDIDGTATIDLELELASGTKEIWHLDAKTFLEVAIDATIFDFTQTGKAAPERTYPSDFRKVGQLMIPFKVEKECIARYSLLEITGLELNQGWPAEKFRMPINAGMEALRPLAGEFSVAMELPPGRPGQPWQPSSGQAKIVAHFDGAVLDETFEGDFGGGTETTLRRWSWDRFDELYRILEIGQTTTHPNLFVGKLADGKIAADNSATGSAGLRGGQEVFERFRLEIRSADVIYLEGETSADGGKTWEPAWRMTYTRKKS